MQYLFGQQQIGNDNDKTRQTNERKTYTANSSYPKVAVQWLIDETKSKGKLTNTLYSVVDIDDATAIIIFGIMSPVAVFYCLIPETI